MNILKRIVASMVSIFILFNLFTVVNSAKPDVEILFSECFNDKVTNTIPTTMEISGKCSGVVEFKEGEKGLSFKNLNNESGVVIGSDVAFATSNQKFFISFDIMITDDVAFSVNAINSSVVTPVIKIEKNIVKSHNGRRIDGIKKGEIVNISLNVNLKCATYDVFINGVKKVAEFYNSNLANKSFTALNIVASSNISSCEMILDNIMIGKGFTDGKIKCPVLAFNEKSDEEITYEKTINEVVFIKNDFEAGTHGGIITDKGNSLGVTKESDTNKAVTFERKTDTDFHYDFNKAFNHKSDVLVYQWDMKISKISAPLYVNFITTDKKVWSPFLFESNTLTVGGNTKMTYSFDTWYNFAIVWDTFDGYCQYFINGKSVSGKVKNTFEYSKMQTMRYHLRAGTGEDLLYVDNIVIYGGDKIRPGVMNEEVQEARLNLDHKEAIYGSNEKEIAFMKNKVSYHTRSGIVYKDETRTLIEELPYTKDGVLMADAKFFEIAYDMPLSFDDESKALKIGNMTINENEKAVTLNSVKYLLSNSYEVKDGTYFVPIKEISEKALKLKTVHETTCTNNGMFILSKDTITLPDNNSDLCDLNEFLFYQRPSQEELLKIIQNNPLKGVHPRLIATKEDFEEVKRKIPTDEFMTKLYNDLIKEADKLVNDPTAIKYELRDGVRLMYVAKELIDKFSILGIAYHLTGDKKYADRALIDIEAVSTFPDWNPSHRMDAGVMFHATSLAYDWFYHEMDDETRKAFLNSIIQNGCLLYNEAYMPGGGVMGTELINPGNHNPVHNGGAIMAGIALSDEIPEISAYLMHHAIRASETIMPTNGSGGLSFEGANYAGLKNEFMSRQFASMDKYFGHLYTFDKVAGVKETLFGQYALQHALRSFDPEEPGSAGRSKTDLRNHHVWFANYFDQYAELKACLEGLEINLDVGDGQILLYYNPEKMNSAIASDSALDGYGPEWPIFTSRTNHLGKQSAYFASKGNWDWSGHRQINAGTFIYFQNGVEWALDLGSYSYELYKDSYGKYNYYLNRAEGHNCVVVNPSVDDDQYKDASTKYEKVETSPRGSIAVLDMKPSYEERVNTYKRGFFFTDDRESLVIRDELNLHTDKENEVYWVMQTLENAVADETGVTLTSTINPQNKVRLDFVCSEDFEVVVGEPVNFSPNLRPPLDPVERRATAKKIYLKTKGKGNVTITAKLTPCHIDGSDVSEYDMSIYDWVIPEGEQVITPKLDTLLYGDVAYDVNNHFPIINIEKGSTQKVAITSSKYNTERQIISETSDKIVELITLTDKVNPALKSRYYVTYTIVDYSKFMADGYSACIPKLAQVSAEQQAENAGIQAFDGNLSTRWSAEGAHYITLDLGENKDVNCLALAFHWGNQRRYNYKVKVSKDGVNYDYVLENISSGETNDLEYIKFNQSNARYVVVEFYGSNVNMWNNITEISVGYKE